MPPGEAIEVETVDLSNPSADTPRNKRWLGRSIFNVMIDQILISLLIYFNCVTGIGGLCVLFVCDSLSKGCRSKAEPGSNEKTMGEGVSLLFLTPFHIVFSFDLLIHERRTKNTPKLYCYASYVKQIICGQF